MQESRMQYQNASMQQSMQGSFQGSMQSNRQEYDKGAFKVDAEDRVDLYSVVREMREVEYGETRVSRIFYAAQLNEFEKNNHDLESEFLNWSSRYTEDVRIT